jgi:protease II
MMTKSILIMLVIVLLSGCSTLEFRSRTIVIPEAEAVPELAHSNGDFEVNKIYRMFEDDDRAMQILGWADNDHIFGKFMSIDKAQTMVSVDYRNQSSKTVTTLSMNAEASLLSPDGRYILYYAWDDHGGRMTKLYDLNNNKTTSIVENDIPMSGMMVWSNNSRYVAFFLSDSQSREEKLAIYDVSTKQMKQIVIPIKDEKGWVRYAKISDDGETVLIVKQMYDSQLMLFGKLDGNRLVELYEHKLSIDGAVDYLNNDQIMFVSENNLLFVFDRRNKATTILSEQIGLFRLTADRKTIAYSKESQNTYVAKLQGNNLLDEQEIFKGMNPAQMEWNPSGNKLYLSGWKSFDDRSKSKLSEPMQQYMMPYIIEFK